MAIAIKIKSVEIKNHLFYGMVIVKANILELLDHFGFSEVDFVFCGDVIPDNAVFDDYVKVSRYAATFKINDKILSSLKYIDIYIGLLERRVIKLEKEMKLAKEFENNTLEFIREKSLTC